MSTKSGPYEVDCGDDGIWSYQRDFSMGDYFDSEVFYVWGPACYLELPIHDGRTWGDRKAEPIPLAKFRDRKELSGLPRRLITWLDRWPETPDTKP